MTGRSVISRSTTCHRRRHATILAMLTSQKKNGVTYVEGAMT